MTPRCHACGREADEYVATPSDRPTPAATLAVCPPCMDDASSLGYANGLTPEDVHHLLCVALSAARDNTRGIWPLAADLKAVHGYERRHVVPALARLSLTELCHAWTLEGAPGSTSTVVSTVTDPDLLVELRASLTNAKRHRLRARPATEAKLRRNISYGPDYLEEAMNQMLNATNTKVTPRA